MIKQVTYRNEEMQKLILHSSYVILIIVISEFFLVHYVMQPKFGTECSVILSGREACALECLILMMILLK